MTRYACIAISSCLLRACLGGSRAEELGTLETASLDATPQQSTVVDPSRVFDSFHPAAADVPPTAAMRGAKHARRRSDSAPSMRRVQTVST